MSEPTEDLVSDATRQEEQREATAGVDAGRAPTADEEAAAERNAEVDPAVAKNYEESVERGANVKGEGQID